MLFFLFGDSLLRKDSGMIIINPQCACTARVTVLGLCVCVSTLFSNLAQLCVKQDMYFRLQRDMGSKIKKAFCLCDLECYLLTTDM